MRKGAAARLASRDPLPRRLHGPLPTNNRSSSDVWAWLSINTPNVNHNNNKQQPKRKKAIAYFPVSLETSLLNKQKVLPSEGGSPPPPHLPLFLLFLLFSSLSSSTMGLRRSLKKFLRRLCGKNKKRAAASSAAAAAAPFSAPAPVPPVYKPVNTSVFADAQESAASTMRSGFAFGGPTGPILGSCSPCPSPLPGIQPRPARRPAANHPAKAVVIISSAENSHRSAKVVYNERWYGLMPPPGLGGDCPGCQHELAGYRANHAEWPHTCCVEGLRCSDCGGRFSLELVDEHQCK